MSRTRIEINQECGERLKRCREAAGLTQGELSEAAHFEQAAYINMIEKGKRNLPKETAEIIAAALREKGLPVSAEYLLCVPGYDYMQPMEAWDETIRETFWHENIPFRARCLMELIKNAPHVEKAMWEYHSLEPDQNDWGLHITLELKGQTNISQNVESTDITGLLHLDIATQRQLFDKLSQFLEYQLAILAAEGEHSRRFPLVVWEHPRRYAVPDVSVLDLPVIPADKKVCYRAEQLFEDEVLTPAREEYYATHPGEPDSAPADFADLPDTESPAAAAVDAPEAPQADKARSGSRG